MSRQSNARNSTGARRVPQLPVSMRQKLGLPEDQHKHRTQTSNRRQKRQEARKGQKQGFRGDPNKRRKLEHIESNEEIEEAAEGLDDEVEDAGDVEVEEEGTDHFSISEDVLAEFPKVKKLRDDAPDLPYVPAFEDDSDNISRGSREYSPEVVLDASSKMFQERQADDENEILALEKRLGLKSRQEKVFNDGFDALLQGLEGNLGSKHDRRRDKDWLTQKRSRSQSKAADSDVLLSEEAYSNGESDGSEMSNDLDENDSQDTEEDAFQGFDEEKGVLSEIVQPKPHVTKAARENPYVAPVTPSDGTTRYVPPSLRKPASSETEKLDKLRRQAQGFLNKLSEANIISIVDEFDKLYQANPRQDVTTILTELLLTTFAIRASLQNTFIILHAAFVAALYKTLGADFGAEMISKLVEDFEKYYTNVQSDGKECLNLISLLANLFTFGVISSALVYDHIRLLLADFGENSAELLLRVVRDCGPQLRSDDPTALKGIVQMMNEVSAKMTFGGQMINIRTRVMMDTITDLKNNKTRQATNAAGITGEHLTRMRKALGTLNSRQLRATEPLGITRSDILNSDKKGKWWLVGASWKGHDADRLTPVQPRPSSRIIGKPDADDEDLDPDNVDFNYLARHYKFNTPTHRSIFTAILSASDARDALMRISKLRLTRKQEPEIPRVLLRLCRAEPVYNPYYAGLARLLLRDGKRYRFPFEVALWKFFEEIGEQSDEDENAVDADDDTDGETKPHELANVAKLYATLITRRLLTLDALKTLNIGLLKEKANLWLEMLFISLFTQTNITEEGLVNLCSGVRPDMAKSVAYFVHKNVRKSDLVSKDDRKKLKRGAEMAEAAFTALDRGDDDDDLR